MTDVSEHLVEQTRQNIAEKEEEEEEDSGEGNAEMRNTWSRLLLTDRQGKAGHATLRPSS